MEEQIWQIISAKLNNEELSPAEEEIFEAWINKEPENLDFYLRLTGFTTAHRDTSSINIDQAYHSVSRRLHRQKSYRRHLLTFMAAASVIAAVFITVWKQGEPSFPELSLAEQGSSIYDPYTSDEIVLTAQNQIFKIDPSRGSRIQTPLFSAFINDEGALECIPAGEKFNRQGKTGQPDAIAEYIRISVPYGKDLTLLLPDKSSVMLNSGTNLTFDTYMGSANRKVMLDGEAYFDVKKNRELPFLVETANLNVKVTGTAFNIKAYPTQNDVYTTLERGEVRVSRRNGAGEEHVLTPNHQHILNLFTGKEEVNEVDARLYTAWADGMFSYNNITLEELMKDLYRWYRCRYEFEDDPARLVKISANIEKGKSIDSIMMMIQRINKVEIITENNTYKIKTKRLN